MSPARDLALIGLGDWGKRLARCFDQLGALSVMVDDGVHGLAERALCEQFPRASFQGSVEEALAAPGIQKVAIATPAATHYELAATALRAGKHVFVEKPLSLRPDHARHLMQLASRAQRTLMVGHLLQYHPGILKLRELVSAGTLGKLLTITSNRLNLGKFRREENALWSFAPHDVSVILSLLGDELPQSVRCVGSAFLNEGVADSTITLMRFGNGTLAQIHVSWLNPFKEQKLTVVGSEAMAVFDDTRPWPEKLVLYRGYLSRVESAPLAGQAEPQALPEVEPLLEECRHFLEVCEKRATPRTDGAEGARVLSVLAMAQRSLDGNGELVTAEPIASDAGQAFVHPSAVVEPEATLGAGTRVWQHTHVMSGARIGERCNLGKNVSVASSVVMGDGVKVQNNVSIYDGTEIEDAVFLGPSCVLTNVSNPRAEVNRRSLFERTLIRRGATVGANATIVCGVTIGRYAFIGAGAVVTRDVPDYALMLGNPARQHGWMSRLGHRLEPAEAGLMVCPESGFRYREVEPGVLRCLDLDEAAPLPAELAVGKQRRREPGP